LQDVRGSAQLIDLAVGSCFAIGDQLRRMHPLQELFFLGAGLQVGGIQFGKIPLADVEAISNGGDLFTLCQREDAILPKKIKHHQFC
jgi:hypothetical protein